jgi:hypothetical protein
MARLTSEVGLANHSYLWENENSTRVGIYLGSRGDSYESSRVHALRVVEYLARFQTYGAESHCKCSIRLSRLLWEENFKTCKSHELDPISARGMGLGAK